MQIETLLGEGRPALPLLFARLVAALLGVAAVTLLGQLMMARWGAQPALLLYLVPVLGAAIYGGLGPGTVTALAATLAYNYFFVEPLHTFLIHSPIDVMAVAVLFAVAVVTSSLAGSLREKTLLAAAHASRNATIAGFARRLLSCANEDAILTVTVRELARLFGCHVAIVSDHEEVRVEASKPGSAALSPADLAAAAHAMAMGELAGRGDRRAANLADWLFYPMPVDGSPRVAAGFARDDGSPAVGHEQTALRENLLDQVALALGRARADAEARNLATLRERDGMRDALLASIGRDVKPSLNAIASAVRQLKRAGTADKAVVSEVAAETVRLDRYVESLLDLNPDGDRTPIEVGDLTIDLHRRAVGKAGEPVHLAPKEYAVLAELAKHAGRVLTHAQLLRAVWGPAQQDQIDYLRVAIRALRQKLETDPARPVLIVNEPAVGYRLMQK